MMVGELIKLFKKKENKPPKKLPFKTDKYGNTTLSIHGVKATYNKNWELISWETTRKIEGAKKI